jgi:hypothetical protein
MDDKTKIQVAKDKREIAAAVEHELDVYPLREAAEDPRWAIRTVWTWIGIAVFLLLFFVVMTILGIFYD